MLFQIENRDVTNSDELMILIEILFSFSYLASKSEDRREADKK